MSNRYPVQGKDYYLAGSGVGSTDTSIALVSLTLPNSEELLTMADFGNLGYMTLEPETDREENISFTGITQNANGTATLTGVTRGLEFVTPFAQDLTLRQGHGGSTLVRITNSAPFYNNYPLKGNDETITGQWTFSTFPITPSNSDASTTVKGVTKLSTAPVSATDPIAVGDNDTRVPPINTSTMTAGQVAALVGTGTPAAGDKYINASTSLSGTVISSSNKVVDQAYLSGSSGLPVVRTYTTVSTSIGSSTTQFDITNPSGTTFRYTFDGTGTDPSLSLVNNPIGSLINFQAQNFTAANNGVFVVTGAGANYVEVTNASGVAENDKTIGTGYIVKSGTSTWSKPAGLKYITLEVQAGGGNGEDMGSAGAGAGGGGGGYAKKTIAAASLNSSEYYLIGSGGITVSSGKISQFGSHCYATGGTAGSSQVGGTGGIGVNGDLNIRGQGGAGGGAGTTGGGTSNSVGSGQGGSSFLGGGGKGVPATTNGGDGGLYGGGGAGASDTNSGGSSYTGGIGAQGIIILTEYYN